ncbi:nuclease-related domain-containing protein [Streptomyces sp. NPDC052042]|uniref:nuclease-related domain-containing protein n=1 Tax=Streptomyces sp. NPDC052042 TaxID=3365683 RepID=UPI0037D518EA
MLRRKLAELEPNRLKRQFVRWSPDPERRSWALGLIGERATGRRLNSLRRHGWRILHAIQWPSKSDIDHLAIGPSGVFTILGFKGSSQLPQIAGVAKTVRTQDRLRAFVLVGADGFEPPTSAL